MKNDNGMNHAVYPNSSFVRKAAGITHFPLHPRPSTPTPHVHMQHLKAVMNTHAYFADIQISSGNFIYIAPNQYNYHLESLYKQNT